MALKSPDDGDGVAFVIDLTHLSVKSIQRCSTQGAAAFKSRLDDSDDFAWAALTGARPLTAFGAVGTLNITDDNIFSQNYDS